MEEKITDDEDDDEEEEMKETNNMPEGIQSVDPHQEIYHNENDSSNEVTVGETQVIQETLSRLSESSSYTICLEEKDIQKKSIDENIIQQAWKDLFASGVVNNEDLISVVGKSCLNFCVDSNQSKVLLLDTWKKNGRQKLSEGGARKTVHHFCMMKDDVQLPDPYKGVWSRYHLSVRYNLTSQNQFELISNRNEEKAKNLIDFPEYMKNIFNNQQNENEEKNFKNAGTQTSSDKCSVMTDQRDIHVRGKKMTVVNDSLIYWTPAPPKWDVAPARVKEVLFPDYHGSDYVDKEYVIDRLESKEKIATTNRDKGIKNESANQVKRSTDESTNHVEVSTADQLQRTISRAKDFGSCENLSREWTKEILTENDDLNLAENYREFSFDLKTKEFIYNQEDDDQLHLQKLKRTFSAPDSLDKDNDTLVVYQDFSSTFLELHKQKQQLENEKIDSNRNILLTDDSKSSERPINHPFILSSELSIFPLSLHRHQLSRWQSLPRLTITKDMKILKKLGRKKRSSLPDLLNFDAYKTTNKWDNSGNEREWVRDIWNKWFDEVFPPTPRRSLSDEENSFNPVEEEEEEEEEVEENYNGLNLKIKRHRGSAKLLDANTVEIVPVVDDEILKTDDVKLLEEEVRNLTSLIERASTKPNAYDYCRRGAIFRRLGKIKPALDDLTESIHLEPHLLVAYWHRHLISILLNRKIAAIEDLDFILSQNKSHVSAYKSRAMLFNEIGESTLAVFNLTQALKFKPDDTEALFQRAQIYETTGDLLLAIDDYNKCRLIDPMMTIPSVKHGIYYFNNSVWASAIEDFSKVLDVEPENVDVRLYRGRSYMKMKMWNEALEDISVVIHMDPLNSKAFYYRGCILRKVYPKKALQDFSVSLMIDESYHNVLSYLHRGILYSDCGQGDDAAADFEAVLRLDPSYASAHLNLGLIFLKNEGKTSLLRAIQKFTSALKADPTLIKAYMCRAETYQRLKDFKNALLDITRALHLKPDMVNLYTWRGDLLHKIGDLELATFCLRQMSEMKIGEEHNPVQRALMQSFLKNYDKAIEVLSEATTGHLLKLRGETEMKASLWKNAIKHFEEALRLMKEEMKEEEDKDLKSKRRCLSSIGEVHYLIGICHMEECGFLLALDAFTNAIKVNKKHAQAFYWRGFAKLKLNHPKGVQDINSALAIDPSLFEAYLTRAAFYGLKGQITKAILNCNEAINLQPNSVRAFVYRGALKYYMRSYVLAIRDFTKAISINATCALAYFNRAICYHANNDQQKALKDYGVVLLLTDNVLYLKTLINRSLLYIEMNDYSNALHDLLSASSLSPNDKNIHHTIGICHYKLGSLKESVKSFSEALQLNRFFLDALIGRGNTFMEFGHDDGYLFAKRDYERALHIDPTCLSARVNLAYCLQVTGKFMQSWHQFTATIVMDPNCVPALEGRAVINLQMSDTFAAFQDINASIHVHATAELLTNRGVIYQFMNDKVNAMRDYQRAIKIDPTYSLAYFNAANMYFHSQQFTQALSYYDLAISYNDKDESAFLNRAITHVMLKDVAKALKDFDSASQLSPYSAHVYFNRANLYMSLQMYSKAEKDYSQAISLQPNDALMLMRRGEARGQLNQRTAASEDYRAAIEMESEIEIG